MASQMNPGGAFKFPGTPLTVTRFGYGAMQLAGPWVMGPPADEGAAVAVLREAVALGITHIDTSDAYGPRVTNQLIREALHPYPDRLHIVTKVGRRPRTSVAPGLRPAESAPPSTTTSSTSGSTYSTWSTSGSATPKAPSPARSQRRSTRSSNSSSRA